MYQERPQMLVKETILMEEKIYLMKIANNSLFLRFSTCQTLWENCLLCLLAFLSHLNVIKLFLTDLILIQISIFKTFEIVCKTFIFCTWCIYIYIRRLVLHIIFLQNVYKNWIMDDISCYFFFIIYHRYRFFCVDWTAAFFFSGKMHTVVFQLFQIQPFWRINRTRDITRISIGRSYRKQMIDQSTS